MNDAIRPCVVIPCLNEAHTIGSVLKGVLAYCPDVIVVDDGSSDDTAAIVAQLPVTLVRHPKRRGKGEALRAGFRTALARGASGMLTMDGDGQHDPADIPRLLAAVHQFPDALIVAARLLERERQSAVRRCANTFADWGVSWACGCPVADTQSGQRWYPRMAAGLVDLPVQGFVFETAVLVAAARELRMPIVSIPIANRHHHGARQSHFHPLGDVLRITGYTICQVLRYGHLVRSYHAAHARSPAVLDPERRLGRVAPGATPYTPAEPPRAPAFRSFRR